MRFFIALTIILFTFLHRSYSLITTYTIAEITKSEEVTEEKLNAFKTSLISNLSDRNMHFVNPEDQPDYILSFDIEFLPYQAIFIIKATIRNLADKTKIIKDEIYTTDVWGNLGFENAGKEVAKRIVKIVMGKQLMGYREHFDYRKYYSRKEKNKAINNLEVMNFLHLGILYNEGINRETGVGFSLKLLEYSRVFLFPPLLYDITLGIGAGIGILDIHSTNAGGVLPITLYIPVYIFPDDYEFNRKQLFICGEWCGLIPQYSYYDINLKFYFNGVGVTIGWVYYPEYKSETVTRKEESKFYGGIFLFIGGYRMLSSPLTTKGNLQTNNSSQ